MVKDGKLSRAMKTVTCALCKQTGHNKRTCKIQGGQTSNKKRKTASAAPTQSQGPSQKKKHASAAPSQKNKTASGAPSQKKKPASAAPSQSQAASQKGKKKIVKKKSV